MNNYYFNMEVGPYSTPIGVLDILGIATMMPLFNYDQTDMIRMVNHIKGPNTFQNVFYAENLDSTRSFFLNYGVNNNTYDYSVFVSFDLTDTYINNFACYYCT